MLSYAYSIFLIYDCNKPTTLVPWNAIYLSLETSTHLMQLKALNISPILGFIMFNSTLSIIFFYIKNYWSKISYIFLTGHLAALHSVVESSMFLIPNILFKALFISLTIFIISTSFWAIAHLTSFEYPDKTIIITKSSNFLKTTEILPLMTRLPSYCQGYWTSTRMQVWLGCNV